jgi:hypothetical protein
MTGDKPCEPFPRYYPELFGAADLQRRLWLYALAYTIRQVIFWPPDRAEADGLDLTHPLRTRGA